MDLESTSKVSVHLVDLNRIVLPKQKNVNTYIMHLTSHCNADFLENMRSKGSFLVHFYLDYLHIFLHNITFRKFILHIDFKLKWTKNHQ